MNRASSFVFTGNNSWLSIKESDTSIDLGAYTGALVACGNGNDTIKGGAGLAGLTLGDGNNLVTLGGNNNYLTLGAGDNVVDLGTGTGDFISAGDGDNQVTGALDLLT